MFTRSALSRQALALAMGLLGLLLMGGCGKKETAAPAATRRQEFSVRAAVPGGRYTAGENTTVMH